MMTETTWTDTAQQRRTLRTNKTARKVRAMFPQGQRVRSVVSGETGTIWRHVPGTNAQGGTLVVDWDRTGSRGRTSACAVRPVE